MEIKDLTKEQTIEIAKLAYSSPELMTDFSFKYQPYDESMYEDAREEVYLTFNAPVFADKVFKLMLIIIPNFSLYMYYWNPKTNINEYLPIRNQYKIFQKFIEWGAEPPTK